MQKKYYKLKTGTTIRYEPDGSPSPGADWEYFPLNSEILKIDKEVTAITPGLKDGVCVTSFIIKAIRPGNATITFLNRRSLVGNSQYVQSNVVSMDIY
jgi:hypothetical protein